MKPFFIQGEVKKVNPVQEFGDFKVQRIIIDITDNPKYPCPIEVQAKNKKVEMFSGLTVGQEIQLDCVLEGKWGKDKYEGKVFVNVTALEMAYVQTGVPESISNVSDDEAQAAQEAVANIPEVDDDPSPF